MCGIVGVFGCREHEGRSAVQRLLSRIPHRGEPAFQNEIAAGPGWAIGTNRLAIVSSNSIRQPLTNEVEREFLSFNGEVYAGIPGVEHRGSGRLSQQGGDGPALLGFLGAEEPKALDQIEGMYAFIWVQQEKHRAVLARDRLGIKPLYLSETPRRVVVSSEMKALSPEDDVLEIACCPPGATITLDFKPRAKVRLSQPQSYFNLRQHAEDINSQELAPEELLKLLRSSVAIRAAHHEPIGVYISGGVDSSAVLSLALEAGVQPIPVLVGRESSPDRIAGLAVSDALGLDPIVQSCPSEPELFESVCDTIRITESFEPNVVRQSSVQRVIAGAAANAGLRVILCGEGADELFCGYPEFVSAGENWLKLRLAFLQDLHRTQLQRVDRMSMFFTTEVRVPFLDGRVVKAALHDRKRQSFLSDSPGVSTKTVLRRALAGVLPESVRLRPKVVLSEGAGLRGNAPQGGMFADLADAAMDSTEAAEIIHGFPEWGLASTEEALYFKEFHRLGYSKAKFMRERIFANAVHSVLPAARHLWANASVPRATTITTWARE